jgi:uncharacterized protein (TIGR03067 family)
MKAFALAFFLAGISFAGSTGAPDEPKKSDLDRLQGNWIITAVEISGEKVPPANLGMVKTRFKDKSYTQTVAGAEVETGTYALDPSKDPKTIDMKILTGNDAGKDQPGIYKFDGELLVLCMAQPGEKTRPGSFETKGNSFAAVTMKLEK